MLNLDDIQTALTAAIKILHPVTKAETGAVITVAGPEHPKRKTINFERQRKMRAEYARAGRLEFDTDPADDEAQRIADLAACTIDWSGIGDKGVAIAFSEKAAADLYATPKLAWLRDQVQEGLNKGDLFIQDSVPPSLVAESRSQS